MLNVQYFQVNIEVQYQIFLTLDLPILIALQILKLCLKNLHISLKPRRFFLYKVHFVHNYKTSSEVHF
jgi:hypothetical protein